MRIAWMEDALCRSVGGDHWFPDDYGSGTEYRMAKAICQQCPVINECLQMALDGNERSGLWGGLSPMERRKLRKERAA